MELCTDSYNTYFNLKLISIEFRTFLEQLGPNNFHEPIISINHRLSLTLTSQALIIDVTLGFQL